MVVSTTSSLSPSSSSSSLADDSVKSTASGSWSAGVIKYLCSYGGKILPRYPDGKLRYVGGETRVLAVDRSLLFSELLAKLGELCGRGSQVSLRCKLPTEDLDALISITTDEDLFNLIEEYDVANRERSVSPLKIRAILHFPYTNPSPKSTSPPISATSSPPSSIRGKVPFTPSSSSYRRISPPHSARVMPPHSQPRHYSHQIHQQHHRNQPCVACAGVNTMMPSSSSPSQSSYRYQNHIVHNGNHWP